MKLLPSLRDVVELISATPWSARRTLHFSEKLSEPFDFSEPTLFVGLVAVLTCATSKIVSLVYLAQDLFARHRFNRVD